MNIQTIKDIFKNNIVVFGLIIGLASVVSAAILSFGLIAMNSHDSISVTGTSERFVESDNGKWTFIITRQATPESYLYVSKQLRDATPLVTKYLSAQGIEEGNITLLPITSNVLCQSQNQVMYDASGRQQCAGPFMYSLTETFTVESEDVHLVKKLSLEAQQVLAAQGIQIQTASVEFFYTRLATIRAELLEEASKNAKERAVAIAKSTGSSIGSVKSATQGVFQVTQKNSTDVSDYGSYDTSTIDKKITALVRASFEVR